MNWQALLANAAWLASNAPAHRRFVRALRDPGAAQAQWLRSHLARNADSAYGRAHRCGTITSYGEFARRVPMVAYEDLEPWIARVRRGERAILCVDPVTRLVPTSGSSGARKLIPFTPALQGEFNAAIGPWLVDLARSHPQAMGGCAYWSVTPMGAKIDPDDDTSAIPVGFDDDVGYLGGARARLVAAAMAVPRSVARESDPHRFRRSVVLSLLRRSDLRLISVWHPSFLALLLEEIERQWESLLVELERGNPLRARRLRRVHPRSIRSIWPRLRVVSCWSDAHAAGPARDLERRLPGVVLQPKGLLATEGCVTLPFAQQHPVAVNSHLFEFVAEDGSVSLVDQLRQGCIYEVVMTTGGGLWRYRLGDLVEVTGFAGRTPSLRFLGRAGNVSDRCGEKLSDTFVARVLAKHCPAARFAMLAPEPAGANWRYTLFVESGGPGPEPVALDRGLSDNPHYALCRRLGQLEEVRVVTVAGNVYERYAAAEAARGMRLGDIKPVALSQRTDWREKFAPHFESTGRLSLS